MDKLFILLFILGLPGTGFILAAKTTGENKGLAFLFLKVPSLFFLLIGLIKIFKFYNLI